MDCFFNVILFSAHQEASHCLGYPMAIEALESERSLLLRAQFTAMSCLYGRLDKEINARRAGNSWCPALFGEQQHGELGKGNPNDEGGFRLF